MSIPAQPLQLVWFKRDLRIQDHQPLAEASRSGCVVGFYCFEPGQMAQPDSSARHRAFVAECLRELRRDLAELGIPLLVFHGEVLSFLELVGKHRRIGGLWSHQETGNFASYLRDKEVARWCKYHTLAWREYPQQGVVRRLASRDGWADLWERFVSQAPAREPQRQEAPDLTAITAEMPRVARVDIVREADGIVARQQGGRRAAQTTLDDFLDRRASQYRGGISSPLKAVSACSRLSPYLAWGSLSLREVVRANRNKLDEVRGSPDGSARALAASLKSFEGRLHWHCHFMQKLESEPEIEMHNMHRGYDGLRSDDNRGLLDAWARGETGYPLVDACMAMLRETGWINFRMRAMLMSFAAYNLWLDWRLPGQHLARYFLDYEPGIHWPQVQMQSGVTGINTLRMYNPVKQAMDHDPQGAFVRRWLPALRQVPDAWIFEPWKMPESLQKQCGAVMGREFPAPVVNLQESARAAKARFAAWRSRPGMAETAQSVQQRHGSRKGGAARKTVKRTRGPSKQGDLFDTTKDATCT
ncbi:MAG TPA: deoxyribodipyrimidine photo-lyase [Burkholderiaceae bacterium]